MTLAAASRKGAARLATPEDVVAGLVKRSVNLSGHATSVALEPEFWAVLDAMARGDGRSLAGLIGAIDGGRGARPLASACRTAALAWALGRGAG